MAFQRVANTVLVLVRGVFQGSQTENSFYYGYTGTITQAQLDAVTASVADTVISDWLPILSTGWVGSSVYARDLNAEVALQSEDGSIFGLQGALTGDTLPSWVTIAVARKSGMTGRKSNGRIFWPGLREADTLNNTLNSDVAESIVSAVEAVDAGVTALGLVAKIVSRVAAGDDPLVATGYVLTEWVITDLLLDSRKSRKPGSGS